MEIEPANESSRGVDISWIMSMHTVIDALETDYSDEAERALREDLIRVGTFLDDEDMIAVALGGTTPEVIGEYRTFMVFTENRIIG